MSAAHPARRRDRGAESLPMRVYNLLAGRRARSKFQSAMNIALDMARTAGAPFPRCHRAWLRCAGRDGCHFDIVVGRERARADGPWPGSKKLPLGNGILTVEDDGAGRGAGRSEAGRQGRRRGTRRAGARIGCKPGRGAPMARAPNVPPRGLPPCRRCIRWKSAGKGLRRRRASSNPSGSAMRSKATQYKPGGVAFFRDILSAF